MKEQWMEEQPMDFLLQKKVCLLLFLSSLLYHITEECLFYDTMMLITLFYKYTEQGVAVFLWCGAFVINIIQFFLTYYLFTSVKLVRVNFFYIHLKYKMN